jgi:hypothetical protein
MNIALAAWHILPWWSWIAVVVGIAAIVLVPGAAAVFSRLVATVVKLIPWRSPWTWAAFGAIAAVIGFRFWLDMHDQEVAKIAVAENDAKWTAKEAARIKAQKAVDDLAQKGVDTANRVALDAQAAAVKSEAARAAAEAERDAALKQRSSTYVTATQNARCPDVPRGYLMLRADAAAFANGADGKPQDAAAGESLDARSGVSLAPVVGATVSGTYLSDTDRAQAGAFRELKSRLDSERNYSNRLLAECTSVINSLQGIAQ